VKSLTREDGIIKALKVVKTDCRVARMYKDGEKTCAIGALAVAAKIRLPAKKHNDQHIGAGVLDEFRDRLMKHYCLSEFELMDIQFLNDKNVTMTARRSAITEYLKRRLP
jgi:hypothetical protein